MTAISVAAVVRASGGRLRGTSRKMSLDEAKKLVLGYLEEVDAEIARALDDAGASRPLRQQMTEATRLIRSAFLGALTSVTVTRSPPGGNEPHEPARDAWSEAGRQPSSNPLDRFAGALFGRRDEQSARPPTEPPGTQDSTVTVLRDTLYQQLLAVCEAVDRMLEAARPPPAPPQVPWAESKEFLDEVHELFVAYATSSGQRALEQIGMLEYRLRERYGIEMRYADEDTRHLFTLYPNRDPRDGSYETRVPALLVRGRLWKKGEALGPVSVVSPRVSARPPDAAPAVYTPADPGAKDVAATGAAPGDPALTDTEPADFPGEPSLAAPAPSSPEPAIHEPADPLHPGWPGAAGRPRPAAPDDEDDERGQSHYPQD